MIIKVSNDLKKQEIFANGIELASIMGKDFVDGKRVTNYSLSKKEYVHTFLNPVLMTDNYKISKLNPTLRDTLFSLFASRPRIIEYDGVITFWDSSHINVWCPSIDTILFAKVLRSFLEKNKNFENGVEIGCGSGFLTKYVLAKDKEMKSFLAVDINPYAIKSVKDNIDDSRVLGVVGDGLKAIEGKNFDLLICNPPYVPRPGSIDDNAYEGVALMHHLVHEGQKYLNEGGKILINVSSLGWGLVFDKKPTMKMKILETMSVPLKVNNILNNEEWINYLEKNGLKKEYKEGYEYWQELKIIELSK